MATIICESFRCHFGSKWSSQPHSLISLPPFFNGRQGMISFFENPSSLLSTERYCHYHLSGKVHCKALLFTLSTPQIYVVASDTSLVFLWLSGAGLAPVISHHFCCLQKGTVIALSVGRHIVRHYCSHTPLHRYMQWPLMPVWYSCGCLALGLNLRSVIISAVYRKVLSLPSQWEGTL